MANISEVQDHGAQRDPAQAREAKPGHGGKLQRYGLILTLGALILAVIIAAGILISGSGETTAKVSHVGDHSNIMDMGHLLLTEWDISGLNSGIGEEVKLGHSVLELHNDGQTVHRLAIWRGREVQGDQVAGGTLVAETGFIRPGELVSMDIDLEPGAYVLICSVRGHLSRGMYATVQLQ